jgi:hypothetical protein
MLTIFHEFLLGKVRDSITHQVKYSLHESSNDATKKLLRDIQSYGSADLIVADGVRCPDESYVVESFDIPGIVLDISFPQPLQKLSLKANGYLLESEGVGVQVMIGIKSSYPEADDLSIHVWRLRVKRKGDKTRYEVWKEIEDQIVDEESISSRRYAFKLKDFAPATTLALEYPGADLETEVILKYADLLQYYQEAKERHQRPRRTAF